MISVSHTYRNDDELKPDLTPLLDIIFIVMVFLLLTASVKLKALDVELPRTETQILQTTEADPITINLIAKEPFWALQGQSFKTWDSFTVALLKQVRNGPTKPVVIGADKNASVEQMLKLLAFLQQHEIKATQLLMEDNA